MDDLVTIYQVHIPAWSTLGYAFGQLPDGTDAVVVGDHRSMRELGMALYNGIYPEVASDSVIATGQAAREMQEAWT